MEYHATQFYEADESLHTECRLHFYISNEKVLVSYQNTIPRRGHCICNRNHHIWSTKLELVRLSGIPAISDLQIIENDLVRCMVIDGSSVGERRACPPPPNIQKCDVMSVKNSPFRNLCAFAALLYIKSPIIPVCPNLSQPTHKKVLQLCWWSRDVVRVSSYRQGRQKIRRTQAGCI